MAQVTPDLKQVSTLFKDCLAMVRSRPAENLDHVAKEWLKDARCKLMKEIEKSYYALSNNVNDALHLPYWATIPSQDLIIFTETHPRALDVYSEAFVEEFRKLMTECGFSASIVESHSCGYEETWYCIRISFPAAIATDQPLSKSEALRRFRALPKFSATVLRITQVVEAPVVAEPDEPRVTRQRSKRGTKRKEVPKAAGRSSKRNRGSMASGERDEPAAPEPGRVGRKVKGSKGSTKPAAQDELAQGAQGSRRKSSRLQAGES